MNAAALLPESIVLVAAAALLSAPRRLGESWNRRLAGLALAAALVALALELWLGAPVGALFDGGWIQDRFSLFAKAVTLAGMVVMLAAADWEEGLAAGALPCAFLAVLGAMVAASAGSLVTLWAGLELAAIAGVAAVGAAAGRSGPGLVIASGLAGALVAVGFAFLAAVAGATDLTGVRTALLQAPAGGSLAVGVLIAVGAVAVRAGLAPFDRSLTVTGAGAPAFPGGVLAGLVVAAAVIALARLLGGLAGVSSTWAPLLAALAAVSILAGGLRAAASVEPRRTAVWLGLYQAGWVAAGLAGHDRRSTAAALFLLGALALAAGAAQVLADPARIGGGLAGLNRRDPLRAAALALVLLSLGGFPPLAGFFGQVAVGGELLRTGLSWLLAVGLLGWLLAAYAAFRALRSMYLESGPEAARRTPRSAVVWTAGALVPAVLVLAYGVFAFPLNSLALQGAAALGLH